MCIVNQNDAYDEINFLLLLLKYVVVVVGVS